MTSATDELRRLLDKRGVGYRWDNGTATWYVGGVMYNAWGYDNERLTMSVCHLTPAQAIDATLGRGTCHMEHLWSDDIDGVCWWCKACDKPAFTHGGFPPNYCPNCGRKVVNEVWATMARE